MNLNPIEAILDAIPTGILAVDQNQNVFFYNHRILEILGLSKDRVRQGQKLIELIRIPEVLTHFQEVLVHKKAMRISHLLISSPSEETSRSFSLDVNPLVDSNGKIFGAVGIFHDITELKAAEQIRMDFVANVSHELRTPLTSIKGYIETLIDDGKNGRPVEMNFLESVHRNTQRLLALMEDLLDLSALESSKSSLEKSWYPTRELGETIANLYQERLKKRKQSLTFHYEASEVYCDHKLVEQVISNLLENAMKYTPEETVIRLAWSENQTETLLTIEDSGPGIPSEHLPRLFERFYRVDRARSRDMGGTGLGLAIVKHILQRHGGNVSVESELGVGTVFTCRFPKPKP